MTNVIYDAHRKRCEEEATRDVIFLLQVRSLTIAGIPAGYEISDDGEWFDRVDSSHNGLTIAEPVSIVAAFNQKMESVDGYPAVIETWRTESVWLDRPSAEKFAKAHAHNYRHGWKVYGVPSEGELARMLRGETVVPVEAKIVEPVVPKKIKVGDDLYLIADVLEPGSGINIDTFVTRCLLYAADKKRNDVTCRFNSTEFVVHSDSTHREGILAWDVARKTQTINEMKHRHK